MIAFGRQRIRLEIDVTKSEDARDAMTSATPRIWRGTDVQFELCACWGDPRSLGGDVLDVSNISSLTLEVKDGRNGATVMAKTVSTFAQTTKEDWIAGTAQHATIPFLNTETAPDLGSSDSKGYYLVVSVVTNDNPVRQITWGRSTLTIEEDGHGTVTTPPLGNSSYLTDVQVAALIQAAKLDVLRVYNHTTTLYAQIQVAGVGADRHLVLGPETT
jgi:hypothetical protein